MFGISSDEEGFDEKIVTELSKEIVSFTSPRLPYHRKVILRTPRCVYPKVPLYLYPRWLNHLPSSCAILLREECEPPTPLPGLACSTTPSCQISQVCQKHACVYNKLNENLLTKHDLTIFIKNVRTAVQVDMIRSFSTELAVAEQCRKYRGGLCFESNFEGGNLHSAFMEKSKIPIYYLCLQNDSNTHGYNQWANFLVFVDPKADRDIRARFLIINHSKDIRYNPTMCLLVCEQVQGSPQWSHATPFAYYKNKYQRYNGENCNTIDFQYCFRPQSGPFLFCTSLPYTYSQLISLLGELRASHTHWDIRIEEIGKSEGGNRIHMVKFLRKQQKISKHKKCIFVLARQHASEAVSSILCQKIIEYLLGVDSQKIQLADHDWCIVPMANPDGVIHGNSRTNLKGYDINRCWAKNSLHLCAEARCINDAITELMREYKMECMWDLHGHTKDLGAFGYFSQKNSATGCINYLLNKKTQLYDFSKSRYGIGYKKRPTFRGQMFYREHIKNIITLETSHFGWLANDRVTPFTEEDFSSLAAAVVDTMYEVAILDKEERAKIDKDLEEMERIQKLLLRAKETQMESDSDPEGDYLLPSERKNYGLDEEGPVLGSIMGFEDLAKPEAEFSDFKNLLPERGAAAADQRPARGMREVKKEIVRKPIYTSSQVQIVPYEQLIQAQKTSKRYSLDQNTEQLVSKKKEQRTRSRRILSIEQSSYPSLIKVNGSLMKSRPMSMYPTASNVKVNLRNIGEDEKRELMAYKGHSLIESKGYSFREKIKARPPRSNLLQSTILQKSFNLSSGHKTFLSIESVQNSKMK